MENSPPSPFHQFWKASLDVFITFPCQLYVTVIFQCDFNNSSLGSNSGNAVIWDGSISMSVFVTLEQLRWPSGGSGATGKTQQSFRFFSLSLVSHTHILSYQNTQLESVTHLQVIQDGLSPNRFSFNVYTLCMAMYPKPSWKVEGLAIFLTNNTMKEAFCIVSPVFHHSS